MTDLNLTELDRLEREATAGEWEVVLERDVDHNPPLRAESVGPLSADHDHWSGWTIGNEVDARLVVASRNQLRPLLDLVCRLGVELETMVRVHPRDGCVGTECLCNRASSILHDYRKARG